MPSLDGKSEAYKNAFSEGFTAGATEHFKALAAEQQAKKNADTASETFNEFRKQEDQALADKFATTETSTTTANGAQKTTGAQKATTDTNKTTGTAAKTTTPEPKALATKTTAADTKAAATTAAPMSRMARRPPLRHTQARVTTTMSLLLRSVWLPSWVPCSVLPALP
nr:hypothetical protein [Lacticaseibacillus thailandensis]